MNQLDLEGQNDERACWGRTRLSTVKMHISPIVNTQIAPTDSGNTILNSWPRCDNRLVLELGSTLGEKEKLHGHSNGHAVG